MNVAYLTRRVRFAAAHRYYRDEWTEARNREVFGSCSNAHGHGHNYRLDVTVQAPVDGTTGYSMDLQALDAILHAEVSVPLDHQHLNHAVAEFAAGTVPTCENIAIWLWPRISRHLTSPVVLHRLHLHEDDDLSVEYFGPSA